MKITDMGIRALTPPQKGAIIYNDDGLAGFGVRVSEGGTKSFVLTHGPRRTRQTIGRVGIIGVQEARTAAKRILAEYTLGKSQPLSIAWDEALDEYLEEIRQKRRQQTYKSYKRHLKKHFRFGKTKMANVTPHDLHAAFKKLRDRPAELFHAYVNVRAFIQWAFRKHYLDKNPMERMQAPDNSKSRERTLSNQEIRKVWRACPDDPFGRIVRILIVCGQRPGETSKIDPKTMMKGDLLTLPSWLTKNKKEHTFPFPTIAKPYLHDLTYNGFSKAKRRLDEDSGVCDYTLHDLRRTLRTKWAELGISKAVAEKYINHISGEHSGVSAIYDRYDYLPEMRAAVAKWERHLKELLQ